VTRALDDIVMALNAATVFNPRTTRRVFRIGADDYASVVLLAPLVARIRREAPHAVLEIWPYEEHFEERLAVRDWDLAVTDRWALRTWRHCDVLFHETFVSIARLGHPRLGEKVTLESFLAEDHALVSRRGRTAGVVDTQLEPLARRRQVALTLPHYLAAAAMLAETDLLRDAARARRFRRGSGVPSAQRGRCGHCVVARTAERDSARRPEPRRESPLSLARLRWQVPALPYQPPAQASTTAARSSPRH
jgi:DNA-binding transcriptional LysR family regulator